VAFVLSALGLFYIVAALLVFRRIRFEWLMDRAIQALTQRREPDRDRLYFMAGSAALYGAAGVALLLRSDLAVWLLGGGLLLQALYYGILRLVVGRQDDDDDRWRRAWNAAIVSTAAFAIAAYAARSGVLS
jgi:uncharacterized membrane protein YfcA